MAATPTFIAPTRLRPQIAHALSRTVHKRTTTKTRKRQVISYHKTRNDDGQKWVPKGKTTFRDIYAAGCQRRSKRKIFIQLASGMNRDIKGDFKLERLEIKTPEDDPTRCAGLVVSLLARDKSCVEAVARVC